jgi:hypothetical protein
MADTRWAPPVSAAASTYKIFRTILRYVSSYFQFSQSFIFHPKFQTYSRTSYVYNHSEGGGSNLLRNVYEGSWCDAV